MIISLISAMDKNRVIGYRNQLPWHLPADFRHFKQVTMGKPIVMGRKTWESIGKSLSGRLNIVVTRQSNFLAPGATVVADLSQALQVDFAAKEIMIIGGAQLYEQALPLASCMYLTMIDHEFVGDAYFPAWDATEWHLIQEEKHLPDEKNSYFYTFKTFERCKS